MATITTTPERVKAAASSCDQAEAILKILFPETFKEPKLEFAVGDFVEGKDSGNVYIVTGFPPGRHEEVDVTSLKTGRQMGAKPGGRSTVSKSCMRRHPGL
ncbi:hypothetical protein LCGC14_0521210 [marine sediment metagenome]|uniref:Uncharacterized protein n=1 Tax=marine sediment metagenome TaxID=412755 RepID=A0A0F9V6P0_9ZZZZ